MSPGWRVCLFVAMGAALGALVFVSLAVVLLGRRLGRDVAWRPVRLLVPLADLFTLWAATLGIVALAAGRRGFSPAWGGAITSAALLIAFGLYERAVLVPSMDAAWKRLGHGAEPERWEADFRFLWRMSVGARAASAAAALAAIVSAASL